MRTPARPRLPDGDCVFISGARIVARADSCRHRHDMARSESVSRRILVYSALPASKLSNSSNLEAKKERTMAWVDRKTYMERL